MTSTSLSVSRLAEFAVIDVRGDAAATFLHGQLTQDIVGLPADRARLAGYCSAKGRLLASMVVWRTTPDASSGFRLLVRRDTVDALLKRLRMFVLRAPVQLDVTTQAILGVSTSSAAPLTDTTGTTDTTAHAASAVASPWPDDASPANDPWALTRLSTGIAIAAPSAPGHAERWWWLPNDLADEALRALPSADADWLAGDMAAGLGWVSAASTDLFLPQSLNFDLIDGLRFDKGCYPGQEVVARAHYRHAVKRRMAYGVVMGSDRAAPAAGSDLFQADQPALACGRVIDAVALNDAQGLGDIHLLMELTLAAWPADELLLGPDSGGLRVSRRPLPYAIPGTDTEAP